MAKRAWLPGSVEDEDAVNGHGAQHAASSRQRILLKIRLKERRLMFAGPPGHSTPNKVDRGRPWTTRRVRHPLSLLGPLGLREYASGHCVILRLARPPSGKALACRRPPPKPRSTGDPREMRMFTLSATVATPCRHCCFENRAAAQSCAARCPCRQSSV